MPVKPGDFFAHVWLRHGRNTVLERLEPSPTYWQEEIDHVIKGRAVATFDEYASLIRFGRRTALNAEHRRAVWDLYQAYEAYRIERGRQDFNDLIRARTGRDPPRAGHPALRRRHRRRGAGIST